jgi:hypothetical protein
LSGSGSDFREKPGEAVPDSLSIRRAWYEGGHPARRRPLAGTLRVGDDGVAVRSWHRSVAFAWDAITAIEVGEPEEEQKRDTWLRVALLGWFAYFFQKKIKASEIMVSTADGDAFVIIDRVEPDEVSAQLTPWMARLRRP